MCIRDSPLTAAQWAEFARVGGAPAEEVTDVGLDSEYYDTPVRASRSGAGAPWGRVAAGAGGVAVLAAAVVAGNAWLGGRGEVKAGAPSAVPPMAGTAGSMDTPDAPDAPRALELPDSGVAPSTVTQPAPAVGPADDLVKVQVGPIASDQMEGTASRLRGMGFDPYIIREGGQVYFQVGAFANAEGAATTRSQLTSVGLPVREMR